MPELNNNFHLFSKDFLKFRKKYYIKETTELIARHKLLTAFIICLLAPKIQSIQIIGLPFYALIEPSYTLGIKVLILLPLLFFLITLTQAQSKFIKGGTFRNYLETFGIPFVLHKKIDVIILLLSLNVVWVAIFFGAAKIYQLTASHPLLISYYCLYCSMVIAIIALLLNSLYQKAKGVLFLALSLIGLAAVSVKGLWLLNIITSLCIGGLSVAMAMKVQPYVKRANHIKLSDKQQLKKPAIPSIKVYFLTQLATYRANKNSFFIRIFLCLLLSVISIKLFFSSVFVSNRTSLLLFEINFETYVLSTLFTFFAKNELKYCIFYSIFPYQTFIRRPLEIALVSGLLLFSVSPLLFYSLFSQSFSCILFAVGLIMNTVVIGINRVLYAYSLRFCLFTSLLTMVSNTLVQYLLLGAVFGN